MTDFVFTPLVGIDEQGIIATALGGTSTKFADADRGKPVKLSTANNYVLCAQGDAIEGIVVSISPETVNGGYSFGSIQTEGRIYAKVGASQTGALTIGEFAVAETPTALGTAEASNYPLVVQGTPATFKWRVIRIVSGTGVAGDIVLLERCDC